MSPTLKACRALEAPSLSCNPQPKIPTALLQGSPVSSWAGGSMPSLSSSSSLRQVSGQTPPTRWLPVDLPSGTPLCPRELVRSAKTPRLTRAWALQRWKVVRAAAVSWTSLKDHGEGQRPDPAESYRKASGFHPKGSCLKETIVVWFTLLKQCPVGSGWERSNSGDREILMVKRQPRNPGQSVAGAGKR